MTAPRSKAPWAVAGVDTRRWPGVLMANPELVDRLERAMSDPSTLLSRGRPN